MMKGIICVSLLVVIIAVGTGCVMNTSVGPKELSGALTLPSKESMTIPPFNPEGKAGLSKQTVPGTKIAVTVAAVAVGFWTTTVQLALVVPVTVFSWCLNAQPIALDDNSGYVWKVGNDTINATLTGRVVNDSARWTMKISTREVENFIWFEGTSTISGKVGYWIFYDPNNISGPTVGVYKFSYNLSQEKYGKVKVEIIDPANINYGNYLEWSSSGDWKTFTGYDAINEELVPPSAESYLICWNELSGAGYLQKLQPVPAIGEKAKWCWDTRANGCIDIECN